jgi:hypothetical protein
MAQILINSRMCAEGHRPICQDTGMAVVFCMIGMNVTWDATMRAANIEEMVNEGVRRAYAHPDNPLRASVLADPAGARKNTRDNTPAVIYMELVPGDTRGCQRRGQGWRLGKQGAVHRAESVRFHRRLGAVGGAGNGRRLVPARHARHRYRRHRRKRPCCWPRKPCSIRSTSTNCRARGPSNRVEELRLELLRKSQCSWALVRRAWAASPRCST